jgi:2-polyprenyl-3-methyl-5-hydroxy-6-metoxy-1,4-benzoquinol methylase
MVIYFGSHNVLGWMDVDAVAYPWDLGKPREFLVRFMENGMIKGEKALDTCCGLGTNGLYLADKGFQVTGIDISERAVKIANRKVRLIFNSRKINIQ